MAKRKSTAPQGVYERTNEDGSTTFLAQVRLKGYKPVAKAFPSMAEARAWRDSLIAELTKQRAQGTVREDLATLTIRGVVDEFLKDPATTALRYFPDLERQLAWWVNHCGSDKALSFGPLKLREARETLIGGGRQPPTVNRYLSAMRSAWNWARAAGLVPMEKAWPVRLALTEPRGRVRYLNDVELDAVLTEAEKAGAWMRAAVVVSIATGIRQGELLRLEWKDLDLDKRTLTVHISKNGRRRTVHLPPPAVEALKALKRDGVVSLTRVFVTQEGKPANTFYLIHRWNLLRESAGLRDFRWHDLRHCCASYLAQAGASLPEIGSVLGHSSPSVTARYAHLVEGKPVTGADKLAEKLGAKP